MFSFSEHSVRLIQGVLDSFTETYEIRFSSIVSFSLGFIGVPPNSERFCTVLRWFLARPAGDLGIGATINYPKHEWKAEHPSISSVIPQIFQQVEETVEMQDLSDSKAEASLLIQNSSPEMKQTQDAERSQSAEHFPEEQPQEFGQTDPTEQSQNLE